MQIIDKFKLELIQPSRLARKWLYGFPNKARLIVDGEVIDTIIKGTFIRFQYLTKLGYLLLSTNDYYDCEEFYFYFLDYNFKVIDSAYCGCYTFPKSSIISECCIDITFYQENYKLRVKVNNPPTKRLLVLGIKDFWCNRPKGFFVQRYFDVHKIY